MEREEGGSSNNEEENVQKSIEEGEVDDDGCNARKIDNIISKCNKSCLQLNSWQKNRF